MNSDAKDAFVAAMTYITDNPDAIIDDCAVLTRAGYQPSENVTCSANMSVDAGAITITGPTEWGLTKNTASVNYAGELDEAIQ